MTTMAETDGDGVDGSISDDELTALALAADPEADLDADALPWTGVAGVDALLPSWYMPAPVTGRRGWRPKAAAVVVIGAFLVINALGFCITYGQLTAV